MVRQGWSADWHAPVVAETYDGAVRSVELAVRKIVHGEPVLNREALANPEALDLFANLSELDV